MPLLYPLAVRYHRVLKRLEWMRSSTPYARLRQVDELPVRVKRHKSLLLRQLGETEMWMQHNKVTNLKLACAQVDGLLIRPGETFSFNKLVGNATRRKGYRKGMRLSNGQARPGIGGGICQLANLLHWMVLHSPLTVTQRSTHSFDPFPDNGRVLPWGVGCSIVYNYVDLQFRNDTDQTFQLRVGVGDRYLEGEIFADVPAESSYRVFSRGERFLRVGAEYFRRNEIWRTVIDRRTGTTVRDELIRENVALVKYVPVDVPVLDVVPPQQYPRAGSRRLLEQRAAVLLEQCGHVAGESAVQLPEHRVRRRRHHQHVPGRLLARVAERVRHPTRADDPRSGRDVVVLAVDPEPQRPGEDVPRLVVLVMDMQRRLPSHLVRRTPRRLPLREHQPRSRRSDGPSEQRHAREIISTRHPISSPVSVHTILNRPSHDHNRQKLSVAGCRLVA